MARVVAFSVLYLVLRLAKPVMMMPVGTHPHPHPVWG